MNIKDSKITILVVFGIVVIIAAAIYALSLKDDDVDITISGPVNSSIDNDETLDPPPVEDLTEQEKLEAENRDQTRIEDIDQIKSALDDFVADNNYYPDTIDEIVPDYISELPIDPMPESYEYSYTCIGSVDPCLYYDLSYTLEVGTDDLPAGLNLESPEEIATP